MKKEKIDFSKLSKKEQQKILEKAFNKVMKNPEFIKQSEIIQNLSLNDYKELKEDEEKTRYIG